MAEQHTMEFQNPVFHKGLNVTVRNGDKWMKANTGDDLLLKETGKPNTLVGVGKVVGKAHMPFKLIPKDWLAYEHDPTCRDYNGILMEMCRVYPDFNEERMVTVVLFNYQ